MKEAVEKLQKLLDFILVIRPDFLREQEEEKVKAITDHRSKFSKDRIKYLNKTEMREFLKLGKNRHWTLQRQGSNLCKNMQQLRKTLEVLVDETIPIADRFTQAERMPYLGKAIITAILQVTFPYKYGVWNNTSEDALKSLGVFPSKNERDMGNRYCKINTVLLHLARKLRIDLWTLDTLLYYWQEMRKFWRKKGFSI